MLESDEIKKKMYSLLKLEGILLDTEINKLFMENESYEQLGKIGAACYLLTQENKAERIDFSETRYYMKLKSLTKQ